MTQIDKMDKALCDICQEVEKIYRVAGLTKDMPEEAANTLRRIERFAGAAAWLIEPDAGCRKEAAE